MLLRSSGLAWTASYVLLAVAAILVVAWLYQTVRQQQQLDGGFFGGSGPFDEESDGPSIWDRLDIGLSTLFYLAEAGVVAAGAMGLRLFGDLMAVRAGGALPAEPNPPIEVDLEPEG